MKLITKQTGHWQASVNILNFLQSRHYFLDVFIILCFFIKNYLYAKNLNVEYMSIILVETWSRDETIKEFYICEVWMKNQWIQLNKKVDEFNLFSAFLQVSLPTTSVPSCQSSKYLTYFKNGEIFSFILKARFLSI